MLASIYSPWKIDINLEWSSKGVNGTPLEEGKPGIYPVGE